MSQFLQSERKRTDISILLAFITIYFYNLSNICIQNIVFNSPALIEYEKMTWKYKFSITFVKNKMQNGIWKLRHVIILLRIKHEFIKRLFAQSIQHLLIRNNMGPPLR